MRVKEMLNKMQRGAAVGFVALALTTGFATNARAVLVDLDGTGGLTGAVDIGSFDWNATSFVAQGGQTAIASTIAGTCPAGGCTFTVFSQGSLQGVNDINGNPVVVNGLNTSYQITYVAKITEVVTSVSGTQANFSTVTGATGFVNLYFSPVNSSQINGSGFNDGTLILSASTVGSASGNFQVANGTSVPLDNSLNGNQWGSQNTITGAGTTTTIPFDSLVPNTDFFKSLLAQFGLEFSNLSQSIPFNSTDPMACFVTISGNQVQCSTYVQTFNQPYSGQGLDPNGGYIPVVGATNGAFCSATNTACPDLVAQTDPNSPLRGAVVVPEPASFLLFGFGLLGMGGYLRNRNRKTK
jgi:PEP-CTERM motif